MNTTKKLNPLCPVCNNIPWGSTVPPKCTCVEQIFENKEPETITIKKSLWDEMLEYKDRIESLENCNDDVVIPRILQISRKLETIDIQIKYNDALIKKVQELEIILQDLASTLRKL